MTMPERTTEWGSVRPHPFSRWHPRGCRGPASAVPEDLAAMSREFPPGHDGALSPRAPRVAPDGSSLVSGGSRRRRTGRRQRSARKAVARDLRVQLLARDAELLGGTQLVATGERQGPLDQAALALLEGGQCCGLRRRRRQVHRPVARSLRNERQVTEPDVDRRA